MKPGSTVLRSLVHQSTVVPNMMDLIVKILWENL